MPSRGVRLLKEFCQRYGIAYEECGKLLVALDDDERQRLQSIRERAELNGVPALRWLDTAGLRDIEPHAVGVAALHSPTTAIVDFRGVPGAGGAHYRGRRLYDCPSR